jgi:hypothetical protein
MIVFYTLSFDAQRVGIPFIKNETYMTKVYWLLRFEAQRPNKKKEYEYYPAINYNFIKSNQEYAVVNLFFRELSTRAAATVQSLTFDKVKMFIHTNNNEN